MTDETDSIIMFSIMMILIVIEAVKTLIQLTKKGIFISQRDLLLQKTNKELRSMLVGHKNITSKKKTELIDLIIMAT
tara:strand:+ start:89 stop:319 length:231 start_codon:yes stop_codon:yes gene_type:complete